MSAASVPQCVIYAASLDGSTFRYVGQTIQFSARKRQHLRRADNLPFARWVRAHVLAGDQIVFTVLEECEPQALNEREIYWIARLKAGGHDLLNILAGGAGMYGWTASEATRAKLRAAKVGRPLTDEHRQAIREGNVGRKRSEETCKRIGSVHRGKTVSPEVRARVSASLKGHDVPEETRRKLSEAAKAQWARRRAEQAASNTTPSVTSA